jgi:hypothetical protein
MTPEDTEVPMKKEFALLVALTTLSVPTTAVASHSKGGQSHWKTRTIDLGDCLSSSRLKRALRAAAEDWSRSAHINARVIGCSYSGREMRAYNRRYGRTDWAGYADYTYGGGHFSGARLRFNETYISGASDRYLQKIACHELGHGLGLAHRDTSSCLVPGGSSRRPAFYRPDRHDFDQLRAIYQHRHSAHRRPPRQSHFLLLHG